MAYEVVATGNALELANLGDYEGRLAEGDKALLELDLRWPISQGVASELESKLRQAGVTDARVATASPMLRISFTKGFPWLAVIAAIILVALVTLLIVIGWRMFKEVVPEAMQPIVASLGLVLLLGLGIVVLARRVRI